MSDKVAMTFEEWRRCRRFPTYEVSDKGRVRNLKTGHILKPAITHNGYLTVHLSGSRSHVLIHVLVCESFIGPRPEGKQIDHVDGNKSNNGVSNLEYVSASENHSRAVKLGLKSVPLHRGTDHWCSKLNEADVRILRQMRDAGVHLHVLADKFSITFQTASAIALRKTWKHV